MASDETALLTDVSRETAPEPQYGPHFHPSWIKRSLVAPNYKWTSKAAESLTERVLTWLLPWTTRNYPGRNKGFLGLLCRRVSFGAVKHWVMGRRPLPQDIALGLAETIEGRCAAGMALAGELREYAAGLEGVRRRAGFCVVDEGVGRDRRHRAGNKPAVIPDAVD